MFGMTQSNNFTAAASSSGSAQTAQRRMHPIRPLTIKQLLQAQSVGEGAMVIDGREITQATVVGRIVGYENASMNAGGAITAKHYGYRITDNTGMILVRQWTDAESNLEALPLNTHVRASGTVKVWQESPIITGTVIAVADSNELNYHTLDAVLTHLRFTSGNKRPDDRKDSTAFMNNSVNAVGAQNLLPGGDSKVYLTDLLLNIMKQGGHGDMGMSMDELTAAAQRYNFGASDVRTAMRTLAAEGKAYQTHDNRYNV